MTNDDLVKRLRRYAVGTGCAQFDEYAEAAAKIERLRERVDDLEMELGEVNAMWRAEKQRAKRAETELGALHKAKYDALLMQGFTEAQALELCKTIP